MELNEEDYFAHYGTPRHSGRYPWGSGGDEELVVDHNNAHFLHHVDNLKKQGLSESEIAKGLGLTTAQLRAKKSIYKNEQKQAQIAMVERLAENGNSNAAIGRRLGIPESSVRAMRAPGAKQKTDILTTTSNLLKDEVDQKTYLDIGRGVEQHLGVPTTTLNNAVAVLKEQGYVVHSNVKIDQLGTGHQTNMKVLTPPGTTYGEVIKNRLNIKQVGAFSEDGGATFLGIQTSPVSIHPNRVGVIYGDKGGSDADGVIYVRPGVSDVNLGGAKYAQVRVQVGNDHYLKGMAMYKDDLPAGSDLIFNTVKLDTGNKLDAFKPISDDPDNPFGAVTRQIFKKDEHGHPIKDEHGKEIVESSMNIVNEEGDWTHWSKSIATQVLSKQSPALAKSQLDMTYENRVADLDSITSLTNPTVQKKLLKSFADGTDAAAVHLKAAHLPRQGWHVILPITSIPENQIYAPNYRDGEQVVLIRYPHGGTFEIPELTVNNRHGPAVKTLGSARDAVGIHPKVAERLSGADFDGDFVLVIPNNQRKVKTSPALEELKGFNPRTAYPKYEGMHIMTPQQKGLEMGAISNLITDMTIQVANHSEIARAIKHSMVVIDAERHELNYKQSFIDNNISQLKEKYQGGARRGASTIISRAQAKTFVPERKERRASRGGPIDPVTGEKVFEPTGRLNFKTGKPKLQVSKQLAEESNAHALSSGTPMERLYAEHSNKLKALANTARLAYLKAPDLKYSPSAKKTYASEVTTLNSKLALAERNAPLERQAQILANTMVKAKRDANPNMDQISLKKIRTQAQEIARARTGAKKAQIKITPSEWEAIQAGAISNSKLIKILDNADLEIVKELAQPRSSVLMTETKTTRAKAMLASGATRSEVADALGVSLSTLDKELYKDS